MFEVSIVELGAEAGMWFSAKEIVVGFESEVEVYVSVSGKLPVPAVALKAGSVRPVTEANVLMVGVSECRATSLEIVLG